MSKYLSPNVYVENSDSQTIDTEVAIGVAGMVGIAQRGPVNEAVRITSWNQYINKFALGMDSPFIANSDLAYAVYGFFQNGGSECVIVRTAVENSYKTAANATYGLEAKDPGSWGNSIIIKAAKNGTDYDVTVCLGEDNVVESYKGISTDANNANYIARRIDSESSYIKTSASFGDTIEAWGKLTAEATSANFTGGADGVDKISDADYVKSLEAFGVYDDISYIAVPGQTSSAVAEGLRGYCTEDSNIVPIIEAPKTATCTSVETLRKDNEHSTGVLIWPWGYVTDPLSKAVAPNNVRMCPPSGHYMGVMSRIAHKRGVWKAPAGIEATVKGFVSLVHNVTTDDTDVLNPIGVVSIKAIPNYGICVWGARTLNSMDANFKYVSDLTLDAYIKRNSDKLGKPYVFEPNKETTWTSIQTVISAFMNKLMLDGAFKSDKQEEAYYVKCDADLNDTHVQKNDGIIETEIGYAGVKPGEFIVFRIKHTIN